MKKMIVLSVLLAVLAVGFVSADARPGMRGPGNFDNSRNYSGRFTDEGRQGRGGYMMDNERFGRMGSGSGVSSFAEIKEVSGELVLKDDDFPAIKTGKEVMEITLSEDAIEALKMTNGSKLKIKGFEVPGRNWSITGEKLFRIFEFEYEGKKYVSHGMGGKSGRRGMMGGF
ncbi:MAG: hypothetical protein RBT69_03655 [Spirochaetia bacterium]|jgi:hypothetical protein|nr:hypothetical protein [Spirochaetia bacterium]